MPQVVEPGYDRLAVNTRSREHVELKACLLAYAYRIDVDELQHMRNRAMQEIETIRARQVLARGGVLDDGSLLETTKRKTSFLLRHFFAIDDDRDDRYMK
ncbi:hypothetical protein PINS_up014694 [Pythium insidiosum]|nr:hypothetical protein PINS_up014694 [Pythium insidiosum]